MAESSSEVARGDGASHDIPFREAFAVWLKIGLMSFGGPAGQIALMHRILVEEKRWIGERRFLHALNYCMLLPGPEAQQLATYIGWLMHRTAGGLVAGILFILPGALVILTLSLLYVSFRDLGVVEALFVGIKAVVLAIVVNAVIRIGRRALANGILGAIAALSFFAIFAGDIPFPAIVAVAAFSGFIGGFLYPGAFALQDGHGEARTDDNAVLDRMIENGRLDHVRPDAGRAVRVALFWLTLWLAPVATLWLIFGPSNLFTQEATFFSKMAVVTFGGAYAVLAYVAQQAVDTYGWLTAGAMLDGLGLAETTPGPLILVLQFVGFIGAYNGAGWANPMLAGIAGSVLTLWVTFVPCFLWIFLGAPYVEKIRGNQALSAALSAVTAAVVGVILNLALWFALHVVFANVREIRDFGLRLLVPEVASLDITAAALTVLALLAVLWMKVSPIWAFLGAAAISLALWFFGVS